MVHADGIYYLHDFLMMFLQRDLKIAYLAMYARDEFGISYDSQYNQLKCNNKLISNTVLTRYNVK